MVRLPTVGGDNGSWGTVLNEFLNVGHNSNGTNKNAAVGSVTLLVAASDASSGIRAVADYLCDGTADESEITSAINALPSSGGTVILSEGTFSISGVMSNVLISNIIIKGVGRDITVIKLADSANSRMMTHTSAISNVTFKDLTFDFNGSNQSDGASRDDRSGVHLLDITSLSFINCGIKNCRHGAALRLSECDYCLIMGCRFQDNGVSGAAFVCDHSFCRNSTHYRVVGNSFLNATDTGTAQDGVTYSEVIGNTYENCDIGVTVGNSATEGSSTAAACQYNSVVGNTIKGRGASDDSSGIKISAFGNTAPGNMANVTVMGNVITNCDRGIWCEQVNRCVISGNVIDSAAGANKQLILFASTGTLTNVVCSGNILEASSASAIRISGGTSNNLRIYDNDIINASTAINGTVPATARVKNNTGYVTENGGTASVANGGTITHGLSNTPTKYFVTPTVAGRVVAVTAVSSTTLTIALQDNAGSAVGSAENVIWYAEV